MAIPLETVATAIALAAFSLYSLRGKLLNIGGTLLADAFGLLTFYLGGFAALLTLIIFYTAAIIVTKTGRRGTDGHETRTAANIFSNGAPAVVCMLAGNIPAFFGALSAALADTFSSEIGVNSGSKPVMITTLREVDKGTDGGVTLLGIAAGAAGAAIIAAAHYALFEASAATSVALVAVGVAGSLIDSLLGATLQGRGLLDNNHVNFLASSAGAALIVLLGALL